MLYAVVPTVACGIYESGSRQLALRAHHGTELRKTPMRISTRRGARLTGALQNTGAGTSNYVLVSYSSSALPRFQDLRIGASYLSDVTVPSPASGNVLSYNGSKWVNYANFKNESLYPLYTVNFYNYLIICASI